MAVIKQDSKPALVLILNNTQLQIRTETFNVLSVVPLPVGVVEHFNSDITRLLT